MDNTPNAMPWYRSTIIMAALVSIITKVLVMTGIVSEFAPEAEAELVNALVLLAGGIGDLVAIKSRINQKAAPEITASKGQALKMNANLLPILLALVISTPMLASCSTIEAASGLPSPSSLADRTTIDESAATLVTLAYTATAKAAALSIEAKAVRDPATIRKIGELDTKAFAAVKAVEAAYRTANSDDYITAVRKANAAVQEFLAAFRGDKP